MLFVALALARSDEPWAEKMISRLRRFWWLVALFAGCALCMLVQLAGSGRRLAFLQNFDITLEIEPRAPAAVLAEISAAGRGSEGLALRMSTAEPAEASRATTPPSAVAAEWGPGAGPDAVGHGTPTPQGALGLGGLAPTTSTATAGAAAPMPSTTSAWAPTSVAASEAARSSAASTEPARPEGADGATGGSGAPGPLAALPVQPLGPPAAAAPEAAGASPFCNLGVCRQHGAQAPRLFVAEHTDGAGHRMANIINGIAVAAHNRMNFGGVVAVPNSVTEQGHDFRGLVNRFFGSQDAAKQLFFQSPRIKTRSPAYFVPRLDRLVAQQHCVVLPSTQPERLLASACSPAQVSGSTLGFGLGGLFWAVQGEQGDGGGRDSLTLFCVCRFHEPIPVPKCGPKSLIRAIPSAGIWCTLCSPPRSAAGSATPEACPAVQVQLSNAFGKQQSILVPNDVRHVLYSN